MTVVALSSLAERLSLGEPQRFRALVVVPLLDAATGPSGLLTLEDALARGAAEVTEVSEAGAVPQLRLLNRGAEELFLLDGEELAGAKQNRILNLSLLVPGLTSLEIPVSCVEQGRWGRRGNRDDFAATERVAFAKLRRRNAEAVTRSLESAGLRLGDQGAVWARIAEKSARMSVHSDTGAAAALYEGHREALDGFVAGIASVQGQVGAAFVVNGRLAGLDLLAGPDLLDRLLPKLVRSYALDALDEESAGEELADLTSGTAGMGAIRVAVRAALERAAGLSATRHRAIGRGEDLRLKGEGLVGAALIADGALVHLGLWAVAYR
jgi:hypothetical protein